MEERLEKLDELSDTSTEVAHSWNSSHEKLLVTIADRANCYRWLHSRSQNFYDKYNFYLTVPSIVISAVSGSATMGLTSLFEPSAQRGASIAIGLLTLGCGVLTSINQYMKTSQFAEAHRAASVAYGKLHRIISNELALRRDQRAHAFDFMKLVRTEQDRLEETSPAIIDCVVSEFRKTFDSNVAIEKPEIVGDLDHVQVNRASKHDEPTPTAPRFTLRTPPLHSHPHTAKVTPISRYSQSAEAARGSADITVVVHADAHGQATVRDPSPESPPQSGDRDS